MAGINPGPGRVVDPYLKHKFNHLCRQANKLREVLCLNLLCSGCREKFEDKIKETDQEIVKMTRDNNGVIL